MVKLLLVAGVVALLVPSPLLADDDNNATAPAAEETPSAAPEAPSIKPVHRAGRPATRPQQTLAPVATAPVAADHEPAEEAPAAVIAPSEEGKGLGGAGVGTFGQFRKMQATKSDGGGGDSSSSGSDKLTVYSSIKGVPGAEGGRTYGLVVFSGPGSGASVGFAAEGQAAGSGFIGLWSWVETSNSSDTCYYSAWLSQKPGGTPVAGCGPVQTQYTGGAIHWQAGGATPPFWQKCLLTIKARYYFNLKLVRSAAGVACQEHIQPN